MAALTLSTLAIPVAFAPAASATEAQCVDYLRREDVIIGPKVRTACAYGASESFANRQFCFPLLVRAGLSGTRAFEACGHAYP